MRKETKLKFRRQHPLHPYIVDFACVEARLIIELDDASHDTRQAYDAEREKALRKRGWTIMRFTNEEIADNLEGVILTILNQTMAALASPPPAPPVRTGGGQ
jgi:very-short-patch-repair endonuclease